MVWSRAARSVRTAGVRAARPSLASKPCFLRQARHWAEEARNLDQAGASSYSDEPYPVGGAAAGLSFRDLLALMREDWITHERNWTQPGLHAVLVQRLGAWRLGLERSWRRKCCSLVYKTLNVFVRNVYGIEIFAETRLGRRVRIGHRGGIVIDDKATVGDDCLIRHNVTVGMTHDGAPSAPRVGRNVSFSPGAVVIGGISIGDRATIGPNAIVLVDVPPDTTVFAAPARQIAQKSSRNRRPSGDVPAE